MFPDVHPHGVRIELRRDSPGAVGQNVLNIAQDVDFDLCDAQATEMTPDAVSRPEPNRLNDVPREQLLNLTNAGGASYYVEVPTPDPNPLKRKSHAARHGPLHR